MVTKIQLITFILILIPNQNYALEKSSGTNYVRNRISIKSETVISPSIFVSIFNHGSCHAGGINMANQNESVSGDNGSRSYSF